MGRAAACDPAQHACRYDASYGSIRTTAGSVEEVCILTVEDQVALGMPANGPAGEWKDACSPAAPEPKVCIAGHGQQSARHGWQALEKALHEWRTVDLVSPVQAYGQQYWHADRRHDDTMTRCPLSSCAAPAASPAALGLDHRVDRSLSPHRQHALQSSHVALLPPAVVQQAKRSSFAAPTRERIESPRDCLLGAAQPQTARDASSTSLTPKAPRGLSPGFSVGCGKGRSASHSPSRQRQVEGVTEAIGQSRWSVAASPHPARRHDVLKPHRGYPMRASLGSLLVAGRPAAKASCGGSQSSTRRADSPLRPHHEELSGQLSTPLPTPSATPPPWGATSVRVPLQPERVWNVADLPKEAQAIGISGSAVQGFQSWLEARAADRPTRESQRESIWKNPDDGARYAGGCLLRDDGTDLASQYLLHRRAFNDCHEERLLADDRGTSGEARLSSMASMPCLANASPQSNRVTRSASPHRSAGVVASAADEAEQEERDHLRESKAGQLAKARYALRDIQEKVAAMGESLLTLQQQRHSLEEAFGATTWTSSLPDEVLKHLAAIHSLQDLLVATRTILQRRVLEVRQFSAREARTCLKLFQQSQQDLESMVPKIAKLKEVAERLRRTMLMPEVQSEKRCAGEDDEGVSAVKSSKVDMEASSSSKNGSRPSNSKTIGDRSEAIAHQSTRPREAKTGGNMTSGHVDLSRKATASSASKVHEKALLRDGFSRPQARRLRAPTAAQANSKPTPLSVIACLIECGFLGTIPKPAMEELDSKPDDLLHVQDLFLASCLPSAKVLGVYRVENPALSSIYEGARAAANCKEEQILWHGTSPDCARNIATHGFNRAYSGRHGSRFGQGTYFSTSAACSARYCEQRKPRRMMFLAKVLVGAWTRGSPDLVEAPYRDERSLERYDSTVDDVASPSIFCIFRDFQAVPLYLIEFAVQET